MADEEDYSQIIELFLSFKKINELPYLSKYTNLKNLNCSWNQITLLDNLPKALKYLNCTKNPLIYDFEPTLKNILHYNSSRSK